MNDSSENIQTAQDTQEPQQATSLFSSIRNNAMLLGLFALGCTAIITGTYLSTADRIAIEKKQAELKALLEIVPRDQYDNDLLNSSVVTLHEQLGLRVERPIFLSMSNGIAKTLIYSATAREGYSGDIDFIIGVDIDDNSIAGVRVLSHKETPGLGDRIEARKSPWITRFNGKSLNNPTRYKWLVKKDGGQFDAFTGATITPRAMIKSIVNVLDHHSKYANHYIERIVKAIETQKNSKPIDNDAPPIGNES